jgi:hypothetical protein
MNKNHAYNVYATFIDDSKTQKNSPFGGEKIADGKEQRFQIALFDRYNNKILPVKESNGTQVRSVDTRVQYSSDLYLDQYNKV